VFDGKQVEVETSVHPELDLSIVRLRSALLADARLATDLRFPGVARELNPEPADWDHPPKRTVPESSGATRAASRWSRGWTPRATR